MLMIKHMARQEMLLSLWAPVVWRVMDFKAITMQCDECNGGYMVKVLREPGERNS